MIGAVVQVNVQWKITHAEYGYLVVFHRAHLKRGRQPFLIDLLIDGSIPAEYQALWVSGPPDITGYSGQTVTVRATLEVRPPARDAVADAALVATLDDGSAGPPRIGLIPSQASYSEEKGSTTLRAKVNSGPTRVRADVEGNVALVDIQWRVGPRMLGYLQAFYWTKTLEGSLPFRIDLHLDAAGAVPHVAFFVPGTFGLSGVDGMTHTVRAQVEAQPMATDAEYDAAILMTYDLYADEGGEVYSSLEELVNVTMPMAL